MTNKGINSIKILLDYLRGTLPNKERYSLEKEITKDPFLEDAMDGFGQLSSHELEHDIEALKNTLNKRIKKQKSRKLIPYLRIAAGIAIIAGIGSLLLYISMPGLSEKELAENIETTKNEAPAQPVIIPAQEARKIMNEMLMAEEDSEQLAEVPKPEIKSKPIKPAAGNESLTSQGNTIEENQVSVKEISIVEDNIELLAEADELEFVEMEPTAIQPAAQQVAPGYSKSSSAPKKELAYTIKGNIVDAATKEPLPGANVIGNSNRGTVSDFDGNFNLDIIDDTLIRIAFVGYETKEISISDFQQTNNTIELEVSNIALNEIVIEKSRSQKKRRAKSYDGSEAKSNEVQLSESFAGVTLEDNEPARWKWVEITYHENYENHCAPVEGMPKFDNYIKNNTKIQTETPVTVTLELLVDESGRLSEIRVIQSLNEVYSEEALRLLREGPEWEPAQINNVAVKEKVTLRITFK